MEASLKISDRFYFVCDFFINMCIYFNENCLLIRLLMGDRPEQQKGYLIKDSLQIINI